MAVVKAGTYSHYIATEESVRKIDAFIARMKSAFEWTEIDDTDENEIKLHVNDNAYIEILNAYKGTNNENLIINCCWNEGEYVYKITDISDVVSYRIVTCDSGETSFVIARKNEELSQGSSFSICRVQNVLHAEKGGYAIIIPYNGGEGSYGVLRFLSEDSTDDITNVQNTHSTMETGYSNDAKIDVVSPIYGFGSECVTVSSLIQVQGSEYHNGRTIHEGKYYYMCNDLMIYDGEVES